MKLLPASEHQLQASLCEYLAHALRPDCYVYAVPNGGARHIRVAVKLKAEGVRRGVPDLHIMMPGARLAKPVMIAVVVVVVVGLIVAMVATPAAIPASR